MLAGKGGQKAGVCCAGEVVLSFFGLGVFVWGLKGKAGF